MMSVRLKEMEEWHKINFRIYFLAFIFAIFFFFNFFRVYNLYASIVLFWSPFLYIDEGATKSDLNVSFSYSCHAGPKIHDATQEFVLTFHHPSLLFFYKLWKQFLLSISGTNSGNYLCK